MLIKITTFKYRKKRPNRMTANRISQSYKVLFFPNSQFLLMENLHTNGTLSFPQRTSQSFEKAKEPFSSLRNNHKNHININFNSYGNN